MAYRLPSERIPISVEDGPTIEVEHCSSFPIQQHALRLAALCVAADEGIKTIVALKDLYEFFVSEAQPTWDLVDHRGPVLPTTGGLLRLDVNLALAFVEGWAGTLPVAEEEPETAVDKVIPPGPLRDDLNAGLRRSRRKKTE